MLYADSFRCRLVFDTLHGFDGMFFFLTVSLRWNDTDGIGVYKFRSKVYIYKVDGYYENENGQQYVLEFNGKFWHGCLHCYNDSTVNPVNGMTMGDLYQRTM
jgi:hypothetical protein